LDVLKPRNPIAEFFWLSAARATTERLSEADRGQLRRGLAIGRQRAEAAEALWSNGHSAEGLRLAREAFEATLSTIEPYGDAVQGKAAAAAPAEASPADTKTEAPGEAEAPAKVKVEEAIAAKAEEAAEAKAQEPAEADAEPSRSRGASPPSSSPRTSEKPRIALRANDFASFPQEEPADATPEEATAEAPAEAGPEEAAEAEPEEPAAEAEAEPEAKAAEAEPAEAKADGDAEAEAEPEAEAEGAEPAEAEADGGAEAAEPAAAEPAGPSAEDDDATASDDPAAATAAPEAAIEPEPTAGLEPEAEPETKAEPTPADASPALSNRVREVLKLRGMSASRIADVDDVARSLRASELPEWDEDVKPTHGELFQRLVAAQRRIDSTLNPGVLAKREILWARVTRVGGAALLVIAAAVGSYLALRTPPGVHVTASAQWSPEYGGPELAMDGDPNTEWQTPNNQNGWLQITIEPPAAVQTLRILNGHNRQYNDRAMRSATIEIYDDGELARTIDQQWPRLAPDPEWNEYEVGLQEVDKIRVEVHSFHANGAALAEIEWQ